VGLFPQLGANLGQRLALGVTELNASFDLIA
jgi:hypothetical protein